MRRLLVASAAAVVLAAAAPGTTPSAAAAAPHPGFWAGSKGRVAVSFTVRAAGKGRVVTDRVVSCGPDAVLSETGLQPDRDRVGRGGRLPWGRNKADNNSRLGTTRGRVTLVVRISSSSERGSNECPDAEYGGITVTRAPFRPIQDGEYHATDGGTGDFTFDVVGNGALFRDGNGSAGAPAPAEPFAPWCATTGAILGSSRIAADGTIAARSATGEEPPALTLAGVVKGASVTGTYRFFDAEQCRGPFGPQPFTATLTKAAPGSVPAGSGGGGPTVSEPRPARGAGYPGLPAADTRPGCAATVSAGPLAAVAACFRARGDLSVARGRVRLNGIDITPRGRGTQVRVNRRTFAVTSTGPVELRVGGLALFRGRLNWRRPEAVFKIQGGPGLPVSGQDVFGLPVDGSAQVELTGGKTVLTVTVGIPSKGFPRALKGLAGYSGELRAAATNEAGLVLDGGKLKLPGGRIGFAEVQGAELAVSTAGSAFRFDGKATVFPFRFNSLGFQAGLGIGPQDGYFKLDLAVEQLNKALVYGFFLQKLGGGFQVNPFGLAAAAGVTFGPQFRLGGSLVSAARLDGDLAYLSADGKDPASVKLGGALQVVEASAADGKVTVKGDGTVDAEGTLGLTVGGYGLRGKLAGWFDGPRAFNVEGKAALALPGPDAGGDAVLSTRGAGGCRRGFGPDVGFGYRWGRGLGGLTFAATSCSLGPWRAGRSAKAAHAGGAIRVPVRRGLRQLAVRLTGTPGATVRTPSGQQLSSAAGPDGFVDARRLLVADPDTNATYLIVDRPQPGRWELTPASAPTSVSTAAPLPRVRIRGSVRGRTLGYRARGLAGRRLQFVDVARRTTRALRTTGRARGRFRFAPVARGGRHRIRAIVLSRAGTPTGITRPVTRYTVRRGRPATPRRVRVRRAGTGRRIAWRGPRRLRYEVDVRLSDGRHVRLLARRGARRVRVRIVPRGVQLRARVVARDATGRASRAARVRG